MRAAVALAEGDRHLRDRGLAIGIKEFRTVGDDGAVLLLRARQEARDVHQGDERNVEGVAEADEARGLAGRVDVQHAGQHVGLVRDDTDAAAVHVREAHDDVLGEILVDLEETVVVHDAADDAVHVVGLVRIVRDDVVQGVVRAAHRVVRGGHGGFLPVVLRQEGKEFLDGGDAFFLAGGGEMRDTALRGMDGCAAQGLVVHVLAGDALDDRRSGEIHVRGILDH